MERMGQRRTGQDGAEAQLTTGVIGRRAGALRLAL